MTTRFLSGQNLETPVSIVEDYAIFNSFISPYNPSISKVLTLSKSYKYNIVIPVSFYYSLNGYNGGDFDNAVQCYVSIENAQKGFYFSFNTIAATAGGAQKAEGWKSPIKAENNNTQWSIMACQPDNDGGVINSSVYLTDPSTVLGDPLKIPLIRYYDKNFYPPQFSDGYNELQKYCTGHEFKQELDKATIVCNGTWNDLAVWIVGLRVIQSDAPLSNSSASYLGLFVP